VKLWCQAQKDCEVLKAFQLKAKLGVRTLPELMRIAIQHLPSAVPARGTKEWS
jgi:hypothetical protein